MSDHVPAPSPSPTGSTAGVRRQLVPLGSIVPSESVRAEAAQVLDVPERRPAKPITFDSAL